MPRPNCIQKVTFDVGPPSERDANGNVRLQCLRMGRELLLPIIIQIYQGAGQQRVMVYRFMLKGHGSYIGGPFLPNRAA